MHTLTWKDGEYGDRCFATRALYRGSPPYRPGVAGKSGLAFARPLE